MSGSGGTTLLLSAFFLLALFIRSYFNFEASFNGGDYRWSGTDAYYHMRVVDVLRDTGAFLLFDPLINFPIGAYNPRPPLFDWLIAAAGGLLTPFFGGDAELATSHAAAFSPAVWGALTVVPIYFLGKEAFGRRAGLWAAFFIAVMAAHITRSNLGAVDHDATILFFFVLGAWSFVKALKLLNRSVYIDDWRRSGTVAPGFSRIFRENRASIAYATFTGAAFAAVALTWQGFPYLFAVLAVWYGFQLLANHLRRVDNAPYMVLAVIPFLVTLLMVFPYYSAVARFDLNVMPMVYILLGVLVASLIFVPTRHLPPVVVLPATAGAAVIGLLVLIFVLPDIGRLFFSGLGYFVQTKLYSTIAEAQRTPLGYLVFSIGIVTFFFALAGIFFAIASFVKRRRDDHLFVLIWAAVALLMAFTATRFVFNASVGFAVLAGWVTDRFITWVRFGAAGKTWANLRRSGTGFFKTARGSIGVRHVLASLFIVFVLLLPNVWMGVDAGVPSEYVSKQLEGKQRDDPSAQFWLNWFGAFGQDFLNDEWVDALDYLSHQDQGLAPEDRPAFMAWWDYGFYAVQRGAHPTVADPFQFGYEISGRVLASQSEAEAILVFSVRLLEADYVRGDATNAFSSDVRGILDARQAGLANELDPLVREKDYDGAYEALAGALESGPDAEDAEAEHKAAAVELYRDLRTATGHFIAYLTLDDRMFPCDDPRTPEIDAGSIFYAPVYLADKNPEDFVRTVYRDAQGQPYYQRVYETTADGGSRQLENPHVVDNAGNRYVAGSGQLFPMAANGHIDYSSPLSVNGITLSSQGLEYQEAFYNTLLYRAWVGPTPANLADNIPPTSQYAPGYGLENFRLVFTTVQVIDDTNNSRCSTYANSGVAVLKYFDGADVSGVVRDSNGQPMSGVTVRVADNFGIPHDSVVVGDDGAFSLIAPFSTENDPSSLAAEERANTLRGTGPNQLQVVVNDVVIQTVNFSVTEDQAMRVPGAPAIPPFEISVELGALEGTVFHDVDGDGVYTPGNDTALNNAQVTLAGRNTTTDADGRYTFSDVAPGGRTVSATADGYANSTATASIPSGSTATQDIAMRPSPIPVRGNLTHEGRNIANATVTFTLQGDEAATPKTATADQTGGYTVSLEPGTWAASVNYTAQENGTFVRYFTPDPVEIEIPLGGAPRTLDLALSREQFDG